MAGDPVGQQAPEAAEPQGAMVEGGSLDAYVGTKIVLARLMDEATFLSEVKGNDAVSAASRPGYLVIYPNPEGDYKSWSPKAVFEAAYRPVSGSEKEFISR